jgi:plasmid maintenance system killer protein
MQNEPLEQEIERYIIRHGLRKKFNKQLKLFLANSHHPSLHTERLEPKSAGLYSFRIDIKYRVIFGFHASDVIEIVDINDHYQ